MEDEVQVSGSLSVVGVDDTMVMVVLDVRVADVSLVIFFSSRRRHTRYWRDWSSDVCSSDLGWYDVSTLKEPYRVEGKKTMAYELAEQLGWTWPDWIVYPTGGGTGLIGMWKAFEEIETIGWVPRGKRPKMVSVQAENCAPIVRAFQQGKEKADPWEKAATLADGLRVPRAIADFLILRAVRESGGTALAVRDADMVRDMVEIGRHEGVSAAPEGGAALTAIRRLVENGSIASGDTVVLFNTGGALKYLDVLTAASPRPSADA